MPTTLRRGNTTFVNLRSTLDDLTVLVNTSKPVAPKLAPFFRELRPLVAAAVPTIADLRKVVHQSGPNNDATDLLLKAPKLQRIASPTFRNAITTLKKSQPVIEFIRPYAPDLVGWFRDFGQGAGNYDANGHFGRVAPQFNAYQFNDTPVPLLTPQDPSQRLTSSIPELLLPRAAPLPGLGESAPGRRLRAVPRQQRHARLRPQPAHPRIVKRVAVITAVIAAAVVVAILGTGASGDGGTYQVRAIFDNAVSVIPGEDVKIAGVKVGKIGALDVTPDRLRKAGDRRPRHHRAWLPGLPLRRHAARSVRSR